MTQDRSLSFRPSLFLFLTLFRRETWMALQFSSAWFLRCSRLCRP